MNKKQKFISVILTLFFSMFALIPSFEKNISAKEFPKKLYNVYLDGNHIGTINSKDRLYKYIDDDQIDLKEKYDIEEVYLPQNLYIEDYIGFESNLIDERKLYETIKDEKPFTVKGSIITIKKPKEDGSFDIKKINVLREEDYKKALENTIKTFIDENEYNVFFDGNTYTNFELGSTIEDIYIGDEALGNITIKRDALIPSDEYIFTDEKKLTHYLLFGTLEEQEKYIIKSGETIEQVAFDHKLGTKEFLIINPEFNSESNLLYEGQEVNVGQIATVVDVVKEEQLVEDFVTKFKTEIKYDSSKPYSFYEVTQEGENGLERVTKRIQYKNG
ncbi:MAG: G5 domain-containing protein, partial [Bacilli bacterium]|nr:G5 domain-containing protein [Bacilli bacterium]